MRQNDDCKILLTYNATLLTWKISVFWSCEMFKKLLYYCESMEGNFFIITIEYITNMEEKFNKNCGNWRKLSKS